MTSLRSRLFRAIALIVLLCVALTIAVGLVLTRRAVERANLHDVEHQAALIYARERHAVSPYTNLEPVRPTLKAQHERFELTTAFLPDAARARVAHGLYASGSVTFQGRAYYYAAVPKLQRKYFVLLRPKSVATADWTPFVYGLLLAALAGAILAAIAAWLLSRRIARPVRRVAAASRSLARGTRPEPVPVEGASELAMLATAFNDLAEQLSRAREAEKNFLLSVSHELKTPLTAIRGYAEALEDGAIDPQEVAATVMVEAARLERLVRDLLDLARMNRTDFSVHPSTIDLAEVAEDAVRRYESQADAFGLTLVAAAEGPSPAVADADRVLQIVSNLVENALRLTPRGGEVRVVTAPGMLRVEDTGPGLQPEDREHAFERFYLHERYGRERPVGTGLGLAIVKELIGAMGGTVEVTSEPGRLTAFTVRFATPAREPAPAA
ncbi:MAG TPA: HAMP domain-containing sensor histidine kinase [Gaiellaceae bacterium]|nr:HAMP domain-containing sensor histidine kinase [Gaiellaceae bacterium]